MSHADDAVISAMKLTDLAEVLLRQVHPSYIENGDLSSQPFRPTPKDANKLSLYRSSICSAEESFIHFGTYATKADCEGAGLEAYGKHWKRIASCVPIPKN